MRNSGLLIGGAIAALAIATPASAALITYTAVGTGSANVFTNSYSGAFTVVGKGDTTNFFHPPSAPTANVVVLDSLTISFGANTFTSQDLAVFFTNPPASFNGFNVVQFGQTLNFLNFGFTTPNTYDALGDFGPAGTRFLFSRMMPGGPPFGQFLRTDGGLFQWTNVNVVSFSAALTPVLGGVPEPANWALMIAGFGLAGTALRRKPKVSVRFA